MTEKCQGDLKDLIKGTIKGVDKNSIDGRSILGQLAVGLSYLHGKEIIHKDLQPANVLISVSSDHLVLVKLADFGLSRKLPDGKKSFNLTEGLGTPVYRAPELQQIEEGKPICRF